MAVKGKVKRNKSAMKKARQSEARNVRNRHEISTMKTAIKAADASMTTGDAAQSQEKLRLAIKTIDQAASKGVLHRNTASRRISRLTKRFNKAAAPSA